MDTQKPKATYAAQTSISGHDKKCPCFLDPRKECKCTGQNSLTLTQA